MPMNVIIIRFVNISEGFAFWSLISEAFVVSELVLCNHIKFFAQNCVFVKNISKIVSKKIIGGYSP